MTIIKNGSKQDTIIIHSIYFRNHGKIPELQMQFQQWVLYLQALRGCCPSGSKSED